MRVKGTGSPEQALPGVVGEKFGGLVQWAGGVAVTVGLEVLCSPRGHQVGDPLVFRLDELEDDLVARRQHPTAQGWKGEVEGIELTLTFLRSKRAQVHRSQQLPPVNLGIPSVPHSRLTPE
ncbi:hypothetical protein ACFVUB_18070 [Streptomyces niveus]|uniref:hypothetical protein n=1 Tax=Streptomyces niveus TaxID=193462 RepID=UPI0036D9D8EE